MKHVLEPQAHDRAAIYEQLCDLGFVNPGIILLRVAIEKAFVGKRPMPENCVVKHCIVGREKLGKSEVYSRCQCKLAC